MCSPPSNKFTEKQQLLPRTRNICFTVTFSNHPLSKGLLVPWGFVCGHLHLPQTQGGNGRQSHCHSCFCCCHCCCCCCCCYWLLLLHPCASFACCLGTIARACVCVCESDRESVRLCISAALLASCQLHLLHNHRM